MKRTLSLSILALVAAALLPLAAFGRVFPFHKNKDKAETAEVGGTSYRYEIFAGYGYTGINQVNGSRYGLQGPEITLTRDWGKHFGIVADGAYYKYPLRSAPGFPNPGDPSVYSALFGPMFHTNIFGNFSGFVQALLGVEHTGGENMNPSTSFAGGYGGGMEYKLSNHLALRAAGDDIAASFSLINPGPGYSPHKTRSSRATFGVVYKF